jgi:hypothetical protein
MFGWFQQFITSLRRKNTKSKPWKTLDVIYSPPRAITHAPFKDFFNDDVSEIKSIQVFVEGHGTINISVGSYRVSFPLGQEEWIKVETNEVLEVPLSNFTSTYKVRMEDVVDDLVVDYGLARLSRIVIRYR